MTEFSSRITTRIAQEISARPNQVEAAVALLDGGATVPFIARYRKDVTGNLSDAQLRILEERLIYLRELDDRRGVILAAIEAQGKLSDELRAQILAADAKQTLEDLYAPYKSKRRTRAMIAKEAGLEPLADLILADRTVDPMATAGSFINAEKGVADAAAALTGARDILAERISLDPGLRETLREFMSSRGELVSKRVELAVDQPADADAQSAKFKDYLNFERHFQRSLPIACWPCFAVAVRVFWLPLSNSLPMKSCRTRIRQSHLSRSIMGLSERVGWLMTGFFQSVVGHGA